MSTMKQENTDVLGARVDKAARRIEYVLVHHGNLLTRDEKQTLLDAVELLYDLPDR